MGIVIWGVSIVILIVTLVDIITRDGMDIRYLPKMAWIIIVILLGFIGSILWFTLGRQYYGKPQMYRAPQQAPATASVPRYDTRSTEEQLAELDREIEHYQRQAALEQRKRELEALKRQAQGDTA